MPYCEAGAAVSILLLRQLDFLVNIPVRLVGRLSITAVWV